MLKTIAVATITFVNPESGVVQPYTHTQPDVDVAAHCEAWNNGWKQSVIRDFERRGYEVLLPPQCAGRNIGPVETALND